MPAANRIVNIQEAKTHLSRLLREVEAGEVIAIARAGRIVARIVRVEDGRQRAWGCFEGQVHIDDGAFEPLPDDEASEWDERPVAP